MKRLMFSKITLVAALVAATALQANAQSVFITEVYPAGSGNGTYAADWFELTNTGGSDLDITGWTMDDSSNSFALSAALRGITSIAAGQSVIFLEDASAANDATVQANFTAAWFGGSPPAGLTLGNYSGSGLGLSTGGDAVNVFNSAGSLMASVSFGATTTGFTFDNAALLNNTAISTLSYAGVNGAFLSFNGAETGSPSMVPEPGTTAMMIIGLGWLGLAMYRRSQRVI